MRCSREDGRDRDVFEVPRDDPGPPRRAPRSAAGPRARRDRGGRLSKARSSTKASVAALTRIRGPQRDTRCSARARSTGPDPSRQASPLGRACIPFPPSPDPRRGIRVDPQGERGPRCTGCTPRGSSEASATARSSSRRSSATTSSRLSSTRPSSEPIDDATRELGRASRRTTRLGGATCPCAQRCVRQGVNLDIAERCAAARPTIPPGRSGPKSARRPGIDAT